MAAVDPVERADGDRARGGLELRGRAGDDHVASSGRSRRAGTGDGISQRTPASPAAAATKSVGRRPTAEPSAPPTREPSGRGPPANGTRRSGAGKRIMPSTNAGPRPIARPTRAATIAPITPPTAPAPRTRPSV